MIDRYALGVCAACLATWLCNSAHADPPSATRDSSLEHEHEHEHEHRADKLDAALDVDESDQRAIEITPEELQKLLVRYAHEPSAASVVSAALRAQQRDPRHFADMAHRARLRGLIPNLDVGLRRGQGVDLRSTTTDELGVHLTTADDLMLFATLRFEFGRLVFAREELTVSREERFAREAQNQLVRQVVHLYFLRRRLLLERDLRGRVDLGRELRIAEAEALLDTFTDGFFGRMMESSTHGQSTPAPALPSSGSRGSRDRR
jgi:hypothetical protein